MGSSDHLDDRLSLGGRAVVGETVVAGPRGSSIHAMPQDFGSYVVRVRREVEARLGEFFEARRAEARGRGADVAAVAEGVQQLTMRGGKRLRAVLLAAGYEACGGEGGSQVVAMAGVSLELFQTYLLAHDDLMDRDDVRRGGPSLPALMRARFGVELADAMTILGGDLASAWAQRALFEADLPAKNLMLASQELGQVHDQVVSGQILDMRSASTEPREVEIVHALKTASYTVRGPVVMGAHLASASEAQVRSLVAYGEPLGIAFQLRDDVLGLFGDAAATGKPAGNDLREGKRTTLVLETLRDTGSRAARAVSRVLGQRSAGDADVREAIGEIEACGALSRVEARIAELVSQSREALSRAALLDGGRALLEGAIDALTERRS
jgi:geranylgeranyl diphosphate synthase type I